MAERGPYFYAYGRTGRHGKWDRLSDGWMTEASFSHLLRTLTPRHFDRVRWDKRKTTEFSPGGHPIEKVDVRVYRAKPEEYDHTMRYVRLWPDNQIPLVSRPFWARDYLTLYVYAYSEDFDAGWI